jgi:hypothetical protein
MCVDCVTTGQSALTALAIFGYAVKPATHRLLARAGFAAAPDPVRDDVRTVAFLRSLDLDPVAALGADVVSAADARAPVPVVRPAQPRRDRRSWRPSHSQVRIARA